MKKQAGFSLLGFTTLLIFIVMTALLAFKLVPPYIDNRKIINAMEQLATDSANAIKSKGQLVQAMNDILYTDYAHDAIDFNKVLSVKRYDKTTDLNVNYEVLVPIFYNISTQFYFKNQVIIDK
ncbi:MAG: DUF4845 domain-containing protein [Arenicellales bacterium WSBS_2016_MAG_OTU3]